MPNNLTPAHVLILAALTGFCGGVTLLLMSLEFGPQSIHPRWCVPSALGAGLGGACALPLMGRAGVAGWVWGFVGACLATAIGAAAAAVFLGVGGAALVAPVLVFSFVFADIVGLLVWASLMAGIHLMALRWRSNP